MGCLKHDQPKQLKESISTFRHARAGECPVEPARTLTQPTKDVDELIVAIQTQTEQGVDRMNKSRNASSKVSVWRRKRAGIESHRRGYWKSRHIN